MVEMHREPMAARILEPRTYAHTTSMTGPDRRHHLTTEATSIRSTLSRKQPCPSRIADPCGEDCESRWLLGQSVSIKPQTRHNTTQFTLPFLNAGFQLPKWLMVRISTHPARIKGGGGVCRKASSIGSGILRIQEPDGIRTLCQAPPQFARSAPSWSNFRFF